MALSDIGLIGLGVMGANLALNMESRGYRVSVYNRKHSEGKSPVNEFMTHRAAGKNFYGTEDLKDFVKSLSRPRKVFLMVKAGEAVDSMVAQLMLLLDKGDIIIDGGNSDFRDTARRVEDVEAAGLLFVGTGVSGGEEGALKGPSIMPGGSAEAWPKIREIFQAIAAKTDDGTPCCKWIGKGGAGHFVKMVHNGIEYGDMQLIAESYGILKNCNGLSNGEMADVFAEWNRGELDSYLIEITAHILKFKEKDGSYIVDKILDSAGQKGTGKWTVEAALNEGDPLTLITESVFARFLSSLIEERKKASEIYADPSKPKFEKVGDVRDALFASKLISYAQGFSLMRRASIQYGWDLDFAGIAKIWRAGCIIRSAFLDKISEAYADPKLENLLFADYFKEKIEKALPAWRRVVSTSVLSGIPAPCMASAISYFDAMRAERSTANIIQAQRDLFGAHTFERVDTPRGKFFHNDWGQI